MSPSIWQILIVVLIIAVLFLGPKRLPGIGKSMGEAIKGFKKGLDNDEIDVTDSAKREQVADTDPETQTTTTSKKDKV